MTYVADLRLTRLALQWLLDERHDQPVPAIDLQEPSETNAIGGPWICVDFSEFDRYAIWKTTGAVHSIEGGAVSDDPIWTPT